METKQRDLLFLDGQDRRLGKSVRQKVNRHVQRDFVLRGSTVSIPSRKPLPQYMKMNFRPVRRSASRLAQPKGAAQGPEHTDELVRQTVEPNVTSGCLHCYHIISPELERVVFRQAFAHLFFTKDNSIVFEGYNLITRCTQQSKACALALDAACLIHAGYAHGDIRLKQQATRTYPLALKALRNQVASLDFDAGQVIATIHLLQICEHFQLITLDGQGWRRHARGIWSVIERCKPEKLEPQLQSLLSGNTRFFALWDAILSRRPMGSCKELWAVTFAENKFGSGSDFNDIAMLVPGLLEVTYRLCDKADQSSLDDVYACLSSINAVERDLHEWMSTLYTRRAYQVVHQSEILCAARLRLDKGVFAHAYTFASLTAAAIHTSYWISVLALLQAQADLQEAMQGRLLLLPSLEREKEHLLRLATDCADNLCMTVAFMTQPVQMYVGLMCAMCPLQMAGKWYKKQHDQKKLRFCLDAAESARLFGLWPPQIL